MSKSATPVNPEDVRYDLAKRESDYPDWKSERPLRTYVLCSHMRSGSTLLGEALYFAGGMGCPIEYFHVGFQPAISQLWETPDQDAYLKAVFRHRTDPEGNFGVKLFWMDVIKLCLDRYPEEADVLNTELEDNPAAAERVYALVRNVFEELFPNPTFIFLTRQDRLRQALSSMISGQVKIWRDISGIEQRTPVATPTYDYDVILNRIRYYSYCESRWNEFFQSCVIEPYRMSYEDLATDYEATIKNFLMAVNKLQPDTKIRTPRLKRQASEISEQFAFRFLQEHSRKSAETAANVCG